MNKLIYPVLFLFVCSVSFAQPQYFNYSNAAFLGMIRTGDGDMIAAGTTYWMSHTELWKLNEAGGSEWSRSLPSSSLQYYRSLTPAANDEYVLSGDYEMPNNTTGLAIHVFDENGDISLSSTQTISKVLRVGRTFRLTDKSFVVVGTSGQVGTPYLAVVRLDSTASIVQSFSEILIENNTQFEDWQYISDAYYDPVEQTIISLSSDVNSNSFDNSNCYVIKTNINGGLIWKTKIDEGQLDLACAVEKLNDGGIVVTGFSNAVNGNTIGELLLVKLDESGNEVWTRQFESNDLVTPLYGQDVMELPNDELLVTGRMIGQNQYSVMLITVDADGNEKERMVLSRSGMDDSPVSTVLLDNSMLGIACSEDSLGYNRNLLVMLPYQVMVDVDELAVNDVEFTVAPNPVASVLNLRYPDGDNWNMSIFGNSGQLIYSGAAQRQFTFDGLPSGNYSIVLRNEQSGQGYVRQVVRQ